MNHIHLQRSVADLFLNALGEQFSLLFLMDVSHIAISRQQARCRVCVCACLCVGGRTGVRACVCACVHACVALVCVLV